MLPEYLKSASYAYRLERVRRASLPRAILKDKVQRSYLTWEAYERAIGALVPDQRYNFERAGVVLQPVQVAMARAARQADMPGNADEIGVGGARGGGKSYSVTTQAWVDDCQRFPGLKVLYLRKTAKAGREQLSDLVRATLANVDCEIKSTQIDFPNSSRVVIGGFKDDSEALKYQGIEYDVLVIEELTQLSERTYKTLRTSLRSSKGWRPRVYATFNPLGIGHQWVKKRFVDPHRENRQTNTLFIPSTVSDNAFNDSEYILKLEDLTGAELRAYRYGDWDVLSGAYFENWNYDAHTIDRLTDIPSHWRIWACMDAGYNHWNIIHFLAQDSDANVYVFHELAHRKQHVDVIANDLHRALAEYGLTSAQLQGFFAGTDAFRVTAANSDTLAQQYHAYNIALSQADMSPGSRILGWQALNRLLGDPRKGKKNRLFVTRNCRRLIETLPYLERDPNRPEDVKKWDTDETGSGGDDAADALRYGVALIDQMVDYNVGHMAHDVYRTFEGAL
jgi:phage terminase large subunit